MLVSSLNNCHLPFFSCLQIRFLNIGVQRLYWPEVILVIWALEKLAEFSNRTLSAWNVPFWKPYFSVELPSWLFSSSITFRILMQTEKS